MERQAKDGTFYKQVGPDKWEPVTRKSKDGTVFKKVGSDDWAPIQPAVQRSGGQQSAGNALEAGIDKIYNSATLGYGPEIMGGLYQAADEIGSRLPFVGDGQVGTYDEKVDQFRQRSQDLQDEHPVASTVGSVAGYVVPGMGVMKLGKLVRGAMGLSPIATSLIGKSATLAGEGAAIGFAHRPSTADDIVNIPERFKTAGIDAGFGLALPPALKGLGKVLKGASKLPKKALSTFGGVSEEGIDAFLADPNRYLNAKSKEEVLETIGSVIGEINEKVAKGKISVKEAKEGLRWAGQTIREELSENHQIAREQLATAHQNLNESMKRVTEELRSRPAPTALQGEIDDSIRGLKEKNIKASGEAFDILEESAKPPKKTVKPKVTAPVEPEIPQPTRIGALQSPESASMSDLAMGKIPKNVVDASDRFGGAKKSGAKTPDQWRESIRSEYGHDEPEMLTSLRARFKHSGRQQKTISKIQDGSKTPYVNVGKDGGSLPTLPNFYSKPTGKIGTPGISEPFPRNPKMEPDQFLWMDKKYGVSKDLLKKHKSLGKSAEIHTSSDLIAHDEYIKDIPKGSTVHIWHPTPNDYVNRRLFVGNPSYKRTKKAAQILAQKGIDVVEHELDATSALKYLKAREGDNYKKALQGMGYTEETLKELIGDVKVSPETTKILKTQTKALEVIPDKGTINTRPIITNINKRIRELSKRNSKDAKAAVKELQKYKDDLMAKSTPKGADKPNYRLNASEAKRILQDLDADVSSWDSQKVAGSFDDAFNRELKGVRAVVDKRLKKEFPKYAEKMKEVSERAQLISQASKRFGNPQTAVSRLSNIASKTAKMDRELLEQLGVKTGKDFKTPIDSYIKVQETLKTPSKMGAIKKSLPEYNAVQLAKRYEKLMANEKLPKKFRAALRKNPSTKTLQAAQQHLDEALEVQKNIRGWTEGTVESKVRSVMLGKKYAAKQLKYLSELSDQDFVRAVEDLRINDQFDKEFRIGSRNVNLWTGIAIALFGGAGPLGWVLGPVLGAFVDRYGPRMTKSILQSVVKMKDLGKQMKPSYFDDFEIPRHISKDLIDQFYEPILVDVAQRDKKNRVNEARGKMKWAQNGLQKLQLEAKKDGDLEMLMKLDPSTVKDPEMKELLIQVSDYRPGTVGFERVRQKIKQMKTGGGR